MALSIKTPVKIALGCLIAGGLICSLFLAVFFHWAKGFDASTEDRQKLYARFIQKDIPASVKIHQVSGSGSPFGGTGVKLYFEIDQKDLDDLISSKHLRKTKEHLFPNDKYLAGMKQPEFYAFYDNSKPNLYRIRMAADGETRKVIYFTSCP